MSSVIPSAKRSHLDSFPMFSNGKTAMEAFSDNDVDGVHHFQAVKPASSTSKTAAMEAARNPRGVLRQWGWGASRSCEGRGDRSGIVVFGRSGQGPGVAGRENSMCGVYVP